MSQDFERLKISQDLLGSGDLLPELIFKDWAPAPEAAEGWIGRGDVVLQRLVYQQRGRR